MKSKESDHRLTRRTLTKSIAGLGVATALAPGAAATAATSDNIILGEFEDGLDDWRTNGGVQLSRVSSTEEPTAVEHGKYGLAVSSNGDTYPVIENKKRLKGTNLVDIPYLLGRIRTSLVPDHTKLTVLLRYHHRATPANGAGGRGNARGRGNGASGNGKGPKHSPGKKPVLVEEKQLTIPLASRSAFFWDLSGLSDEKLETPQRLEIGWFVGDSVPRRGPRGNQHDGPDPKTVYLDSIRWTSSRDFVDRAALMNYMDQLVLQHGDYRYESRGFFDGGERGVFIFTDGTEIDSRWKDLGSDKERYTIGERVFKLGGGWE